MTPLSVYVICLLFLFQSCSKGNDQTNHNQPVNNDACKDWIDATIENKTGLDGCGWVLKLNNGSYLEPTNISDFDIELIDGKPVSLSYVEASGMLSICMIGKIVNINCMKER